MDAQRISDILLSSWVLAAPGKNLPTGRDTLDRALQKAIDRGSFPPEFRQFRFVHTPTGIRCTELRAALTWAQASDQTSDPNPAYAYTAVKPSKFVSVVILNELGISQEDATRWGEELLKAIDEERQEVDFSVSAG